MTVCQAGCPRALLAAAAIAALVAAVLDLSACARVTNPTITSSSLVGRWVSAHDGSLTFGAGQGFAAERLRNPFFGSAQCSGTGTWQFTNSQGDTGTSPTEYTTSDEIAVFYNPNGPTGGGSPGFGCGPFELITWYSGGTPGLCMDFDPDSPCTGEVYVKRGSG